MSYSINTTANKSQNVQKEDYYTKDQLRQDLKDRDGKAKYSNRPGTTAWGFGKEQQMNQGPAGVQKKRGLRGLFATDHAKGAEKEARKELFHAEKAERLASRARDPALTDRQRQKFLRKAAKQQASADFHESLKKKHIIGATPGHKYQAVPPMATHHPLIHDNTNNTIRATVNDQVFQPSRIPVGPAAFDGISEVGSRQMAEPHPAVLNVSTKIPAQDRWEGKVYADRKLSEGQPPYVPVGNQQAMPAPVASADPFLAREQQLKQEKIQQQPQQIQQQPQQIQQPIVYQQQALPVYEQRQIQQPIVYQQQPTMIYQQPQQYVYSYPEDDEYSSDNDSEDESRDLPSQQQRQALPFTATQLQQQSQGLNQTSSWRQRKSLFSRAQLREGARGLQHSRTNYKQGRWINANQLQSQGQRLRKVQTIEKGGLSSFSDEWSKRREWSQQRSLQLQPETNVFVLFVQPAGLKRTQQKLKKTQTRERSGNWLQSKDLKSQGQRLRRAQTTEKGGLNSFSDEWSKRREIRNNNIKALQQQQAAAQQNNQQILITYQQTTSAQ